MKAPSTTIQAPEKHQALSSKPVIETHGPGLVIGVWMFSGCWSLGFGAFNL
jgi:hypothetical protein